MSESSLGLNTSKRKFYKLLDNLSSSRIQFPPASAHIASTTGLAVAEPPSKRRFLSKSRPNTAGAPSSPARPTTSGAKERPRSSIFAVGSSTKARPRSVVSEHDVMLEQTKKTPNYAPWSHDQFLERLKTFADVRSWTPKPAAIGEVEWAKRGWTVISKDVVGCKGGCEKRLVIKLEGKENKSEEKSKEEDDDWWLGDLESEMVNRYRGLIIDGHAEECLWRKQGCKDDIYRIKMADPATWQLELRERYLSLLTVEASLPTKLDIRPQEMPEGQGAIDVAAMVKLIPSDVLERPRKPGATEERSDASAGVNQSALGLALAGWSSQTQGTVHLAYCTKCFQRAGLWLYKPKTPPSEDDMLFNPIEQHREHCPWRNAITQASTGRLEGMPGWQVLITLIRGYRRPDAANGSRSPIKKVQSRPASVYTEDGLELDDDEDDGDGKTSADLEKEDKERRSRLQKLKKALSVRKGKTLSKGAKE